MDVPLLGSDDSEDSAHDEERHERDDEDDVRSDLSEERVKRRKPFPIVLLLFGLFLVVVGSTAPGQLDRAVEDAVWAQMRMDVETAPSFKSFVSMNESSTDDDSIYLKFRIYHIENSVRFLSAKEKLKVVEKGPFIYRLSIRHIKPSIEGGDTGEFERSHVQELFYKPFQQAHLIVGGENGGLDDQEPITQISMPYQAVLALSRTLHMKGLQDLVTNFFLGKSLKERREKLFVTKTAREILFGYHEDFGRKQRRRHLKKTLQDVYEDDIDDETFSDPELPRDIQEHLTSASEQYQARLGIVRFVGGKFTGIDYPGFVQNFSSVEEVDAKLEFDGQRVDRAMMHTFSYYQGSSEFRKCPKAGCPLLWNSRTANRVLGSDGKFWGGKKHTERAVFLPELVRSAKIVSKPKSEQSADISQPRRTREARDFAESGDFIPPNWSSDRHGDERGTEPSRDRQGEERRAERSSDRHGEEREWSSDRNRDERGTERSRDQQGEERRAGQMAHENSRDREDEKAIFESSTADEDDEGEKVEVDGIRCRRWRLHPSVFSNASYYAENSAYYGLDQPLGLFNVGPLLMDIPIFASKPRYLHADPILRDMIEGIPEPNLDEHDVTFDVHEETGISVLVSERFQYVLRLDSASLSEGRLLDQEENGKDELINRKPSKKEKDERVYVPIFWFETIERMSNKHEHLFHRCDNFVKAARVLNVTGMVLGIFCIVLGVAVGTDRTERDAKRLQIKSVYEHLPLTHHHSFQVNAVEAIDGSRQSDKTGIALLWSSKSLRETWLSTPPFAFLVNIIIEVVSLKKSKHIGVWHSYAHGEMPVYQQIILTALFVGIFISISAVSVARGAFVRGEVPRRQIRFGPFAKRRFWNLPWTITDHACGLGVSVGLFFIVVWAGPLNLFIYVFACGSSISANRCTWFWLTYALIKSTFAAIEAAIVFPLAALKTLDSPLPS